MTKPEASQRIAALASNRLLKGLRPMLQDLPAEEWSNDPAYDAAARAMAEHGLAFDALVRAPQLTPLLAFARRHPALRIVIDHAAKPPIASGRLEAWRDDIARLAALPQVHCKLSGLLTEAGTNANAATLQACVAHLFANFGAERLLWGSDWPVLELASDYAAWLAMARALCEAQPGIDAAALAAIFGGNARRFYRLH
jgi:L-fuconolactonase